jgi:hypothetical protein
METTPLMLYTELWRVGETDYITQWMLLANEILAHIRFFLETVCVHIIPLHVSLMSCLLCTFIACDICRRGPIHLAIHIETYV